MAIPNRLSGQLDYSEVSFSSGDFVDGNKNRPVFTFNQAIDTYPDFFKIKLVQFPFTYYVFSAGYTSCTINGTSVSWPQGNYTPSEWLAVINPQLTNISGTYNTSQNKLVFTHSLGTALTISFSGAELAWQHLGFNSGVNTGASPFTSPNVVSFSGPNYVYLRSTFSSVYNQAKFINTRNTVSGAFGDVLSLIPVNVDRNQVSLYQPQDDEFFLVPSTNTQRIDFYFTLGERTTVLDFNGETFQVILTGKEILL